MALHCTHPHKQRRQTCLCSRICLLRMFFWHCKASFLRIFYALVSSLSLDRYLTNIYQKISSKTIILILQFICTICIYMYIVCIYISIYICIHLHLCVGQHACLPDIYGMQLQSCVLFNYQHRIILAFHSCVYLLYGNQANINHSSRDSSAN